MIGALGAIKVVGGDYQHGRFTYDGDVPFRNIKSIKVIEKARQTTFTDRIAGATGGIIGGIAAAALAGGLTGGAGLALGAVAGGAIVVGKMYEMCRVDLVDKSFVIASARKDIWKTIRGLR